MFILAALAVLGGDSLTDFAVALLLGLTRRDLLDDLHRVTAGDLGRGAVAAAQPVARPPRSVDPYADVPVAGRESGRACDLRAGSAERGAVRLVPAPRRALRPAARRTPGSGRSRHPTAGKPCRHRPQPAPPAGSAATDPGHGAILPAARARRHVVRPRRRAARPKVADPDTQRPANPVSTGHNQPHPPGSATTKQARQQLRPAQASPGGRAGQPGPSRATEPPLGPAAASSKMKRGRLVAGLRLPRAGAATPRRPRRRAVVAADHRRGHGQLRRGVAVLPRHPAAARAADRDARRAGDPGRRCSPAASTGWSRWWPGSSLAVGVRGRRTAGVVEPRPAHPGLDHDRPVPAAARPTSSRSRSAPCSCSASARSARRPPPGSGSPRRWWAPPWASRRTCCFPPKVASADAGRAIDGLADVDRASCCVRAADELTELVAERAATSHVGAPAGWLDDAAADHPRHPPGRRRPAARGGGPPAQRPRRRYAATWGPGCGRASRRWSTPRSRSAACSGRWSTRRTTRTWLDDEAAEDVLLGLAQTFREMAAGVDAFGAAGPRRGRPGAAAELRRRRRPSGTRSRACTRRAPGSTTCS